MELIVKFRKSVMLGIKLLSVAAMLLLFVGFWQTFGYTMLSTQDSYLIAVSYVIILVMVMHLYGGFRIGINRIHEIIYSQCLSLVFTNFLMYLELSLVIGDLVPIPPFIFSLISQAAMAIITAYCANTVYFKLYKPRKMLAIFGDDALGFALIDKISKIPDRFKIERGVSVLKYKNEEIKRIIDDYEAVVICDIEPAVKYDLLKYCYIMKKRIYCLPSSTDIVLSNSYNIQISDTPVLMCRNRGLTVDQEFLKRVFDIVLSSVGIIVSSPIMFVLSIAIKICDGGPVLFKQNRVTKDGRIFNVLKFRSMIVDADKEGVKKATDNDSRITPVGKIMRPMRLDELPQLFNILFGSMSFVGPRPERVENVYEYTTRFPDFDLRHRVKGGLTGYAQIYGKYNTSPEDKLKMDLMYIERYSLFLDLKLIAMTVKILFMKESTEGFSDKNSLTKLPETAENEEDKNGI